MAGDGGYEVRPDELATHAKAVEQVGKTLGQALSAAEQVTMGVQAYGMICGPLFVPIVLGVSAPGLATLGLAAEAMGTVSDAVKLAVTTYQTAEQNHKQAIDNLGKKLP
ncbi:type VII secretion target [Amycolatopsis benzoatilytica]|uniref:type VII secretion target n=1 Tax=Amycolatopsis benzoatilytica TaxID=346045 RepID=UPI0003641B3A|nr:type VII secretion target [Amycolatopsis benzoatilytica]